MTPTHHGRLLLPLAYMAALFALSSIPGDIKPDTTVGALFQWVTPNLQNLLHVPLYAGLTLSWFWALAPYSLARQKQLFIALALAMLWGALDEVHQTGVPGRYGSLTDVALNLAGAVAAALFIRKRY